MSAEPTTPIATPLSWLKDEIDRSLGEARAALARTLREPGERPAWLTRCAHPVRQIRGALQILNLEGAARFCCALEQTVQRFAELPARINELNVSVVDRALFALSQFVDDVAKGEPDVPLKLFPVYRELGELCDRTEISENELFFPDVSRVPPGARCPERLDAEQRRHHVGAARAQFQRGLVPWLRNPGDAQALQSMRAALEALDRIADQLGTPAGIWWVGAGLIDLVAHTDAHADRIAFKPLLVRIERVMRAAAGGATEDASELMRDLLYPIAAAAPVCPRICDIKSLYKLDEQLPEFCLSGTLEYDVSALAPVLEDMRQKLLAMEEAWARYTAGSSDDLRRLRAQTAALKDVARDLGHYRLVRLLDIVGLIASKLPEAYPASNDVLALEMAAALLFMEGMLEHFTSPPADIDQQVAVMVGWLLDALKPRGMPVLAGAPRDDITQRQHYVEVRAQVAREILANLERAERTLDEIARDPELGKRIGTLHGPMRQIAGALKMLGLTRANGVLSACLHLMNLAVSGDASLTRASLEWVADGLSCLGFYLENVCHGEIPNEEILLGFVQRLSRDDACAAGSEGWIPPAGSNPAPPVAANEPDASAPLEFGPGADDIPAPADADAPVCVDADAPAEEESDARVLRSTYLDEARVLLADIRAGAARLRDAPDDLGRLTEVRRNFHTLKGGARVTGLDRVGALAWDVEHTLNGCLDAHSPATEELLVLIDEAAETLATTVEALAQRREPDFEGYDSLAELAAALREPVPPEMAEPADAASAAAVDAPAAEPVDAAVADASGDEPEAEAVAIGPVRMSQALYRIYLDETEALVQSMAAELGRLADGTTGADYEMLMRGAHTLRSTANTTGFEPVAALAGTLEAVLEQLRNATLRSGDIEALRSAVQALAGMLAEIRNGRLPSEDAAVTAALQALLLELETAQPPAVQDDSVAPQPQPARAGAADTSLLAAFLEEADQILPRLRSELVRWRRCPGASEYALSVARALHTLKGSARTADANAVGDLAHALEGRVVTALDRAAQDEDFFAELQDALEGIACAIEDLRPHVAEHASDPHADRILPAGETDPSPSLDVQAEVVDRLVEQAGRIGAARLRIAAETQSIHQSLLDLTESVGRLRALLREVQIEADSQVQSRSRHELSQTAGFDPLELDRYTRLQELTRMLAESLHDVQMIQQTLVTSSAETEAALAQQARLARELQQELIGMRSQPFGALRERLQRTVRQSAQSLGREAELVIEGEDIELDRNLLQRLAAPLEHMLRNAVAHGVEPVEVRAALGKPPVGRIDLKLERRALEAILTLADDGAGLDRDAIGEAARRLGLISGPAGAGASTLDELIFAPGLTTASVLTESAGRGIGLDVARTEIAALGGTIEVTSTRGAGSTFRIRLPLSAVSAEVVLVRAAESLYAIPSAWIKGVEELDADALERACADGTVTSGGVDYPLFGLARLLGREEPALGVARRNALLLLDGGERRMAIHVDEVVRGQEAVLEPMGPQLARVPGLAGITILGSDQVVLVLDPLRCPAAASERIAASGASGRAQQAHAAHVMVVDDSLTVRRLTGRLLARAGYEVSSAKDGTDALQQMQRTLPDLVVLDLEMPRMDGFELARQMRADPRTAAVPIVIVTSRLAEKHQRRAAELGADAFFGKPYPEDELLQCIDGLLRKDERAQAA